MRKLWLAAFLAIACSNKLEGEVEVNGAKVGVASCRNGAIYGYRGVELTTRDGDRVRVAMIPTGEGVVIFMKKGETTGPEIGACATLELENQSSTINDVKNVQGKTTLDCSADGLNLRGTVKFENCH